MLPAFYTFKCTDRIIMQNSELFSREKVFAVVKALSRDFFPLNFHFYSFFLTQPLLTAKFNFHSHGSDIEKSETHKTIYFPWWFAIEFVPLWWALECVHSLFRFHNDSLMFTIVGGCAVNEKATLSENYVSCIWVFLHFYAWVRTYWVKHFSNV